MPKNISKKAYFRLQAVLFVICLLPVALIIFKCLKAADPVELITRETGEFALRFMVLTLTISPLQNILGYNWLIKLRRMIGLYVFFYALIHFCVYVFLDLRLDFSILFDDIIKRKYITVGFFAFVFLVSLAATSNKFAIKKISTSRWLKLHKLVYVIAILGTIHYLWQVKGQDYSDPAVYGVLFLILFALRIPRVKSLLKRRTRR